MELFFTGLFLLIAFSAPKPGMAALFLFTDWFAPLAHIWVLAVIGFFFLPYTLLCYSVIVHLFDSAWGFIQAIALLAALAMDLSDKIV
jgi:hypothetical protein